eukprot:1181721-Prorocentrum_minimum.AAC.4
MTFWSGQHGKLYNVFPLALAQRSLLGLPGVARASVPLTSLCADVGRAIRMRSSVISLCLFA